MQLYKNGLAYRKEAPVNWCPSCMTVLSNEQSAVGRCERCESEVLRRDMTQWFFKITEYAEELLAGLESLDWPLKTKQIQRNWIGKSTGAEIIFTSGKHSIPVFTTRADTLTGVTYIVLAPEHPFVPDLTTDDRQAAVKNYVDFAARKSEIERLSAAKEKTGVFTGSYAEHPITGKLVPIWISDYVLQSYGTGAVMAVPAHDERDHAFAVKFGLPVLQVIGVVLSDKEVISETSSEFFSETLSEASFEVLSETPSEASFEAPSENVPFPFCNDGILINSGIYNSLNSEQARERITADLARDGKAKSVVAYRLRDWSVSRQRYWGCPIPVVYCEKCGTVPVNENDLPVTLPYDVEFQPNGRSPLLNCENYVNAPCPKCGSPAKRETDTLDTFVCSSWYYLRFYDNKNSQVPFDKKRISQIMPVDKYVGGIEHASMHLLYARFITKALHDMGFLEFDEPFPSLFHQGIISGKDGKRMSKRAGALPPDVFIDRYGADILRMYLGFGFSYVDGGTWEDEGINSIARFASRIGKTAESFISFKRSSNDKSFVSDRDVDFTRNRTIKQVTNDFEKFSFNTAIARIMEYLNAIHKYQTGQNRNPTFEEAVIKDMVLLLAPMAPHFCEELWEFIGCPYSIHNQPFPVCDETKLASDTMNIAVQVNGVLKDVITACRNESEEEIKASAMKNEKVRKAVAARHVKQIVYVKGRVVNIVPED